MQVSNLVSDQQAFLLVDESALLTQHDCTERYWSGELQGVNTRYMPERVGEREKYIHIDGV